MTISPGQLITAIESTVMLILFAVLVFHLWPAQRLVTFRQRMFILRDELFDYAADGNISFSDPAYRLLRQSMNGFIRYGHQLTLFRIVVNTIRMKVVREEPEWVWYSKWEPALKNLKRDDVRDKLLEFHARSNNLAIDHLVFGSPVLLVLVIVAMSLDLISSGWHSVKESCRRAATTSISTIVDPRILDEEAAAQN